MGFGMLSGLTCTFCLGALLGALDSRASEPLGLQDYMALSGPEPSVHLAYGSAPSQFVELFTPAGEGPFPVVVLVHGGCWQSEFEGIKQMRNLAGPLAAQNIAVWNVEYRRIDEAGGGYPGTYQDIGAALELLAATAPQYHLDLERIVAVGHSAGGQLVRWVAGRRRIPASSPLYREHLLEIREVVALGSVGDDLRHDADRLAQGCDVDVSRLTGASSATRTDVYADTSPSELVPNGSHTVLINGELDRLAPPSYAAANAELARKAGDVVETVILPGASHFDEVAARQPGWALTLARIRGALGLAGTP